MKVIKGKVYKAIKNVPKGELLENRRYIFVGEGSNYMIYDRFPEYLISRTYHFFDVEKEIFCEWTVEGKDEQQDIILPNYLHETNEGWIRPGAGEVAPMKREDFDFGRGKELLRDHVAYFKSIAEGKADIENIFVWLERYDLMLSSQLTGKEKLEFRIYPLKSVCYWLDYFSVPYELSYKYYWVDKMMSAW